MAINKFNVSLSFGEVERLVKALRKLRDDNQHSLYEDVDGYAVERKYNSETKEYETVEPYIEVWRVTTAEKFVEEFTDLNEIISWFTGEFETIDVSKLAVLRAARKRYEDETAARKAAAEAEAEVN